jgi:hypothetical protein
MFFGLIHMDNLSIIFSFILRDKTEATEIE